MTYERPACRRIWPPNPHLIYCGLQVRPPNLRVIQCRLSQTNGTLKRLTENVSIKARLFIIGVSGMKITCINRAFRSASPRSPDPCLYTIDVSDTAAVIPGSPDVAWPFFSPNSCNVDNLDCFLMLLGIDRRRFEQI